MFLSCIQIKQKVSGVRESAVPYATLDYLLQMSVRKESDESRKTGKMILECLIEI